MSRRMNMFSKKTAVASSDVTAVVYIKVIG